MITFDPKYIFTATQSTVIIYFVIILFNTIFWIVDSVRGNAPSPEHASPPLLTVLIGLLLGFLVALPITFASYALLLFLNPYLFILRVPFKVIVFLATCLLTMVAMDLTVVFIDKIAKRLKTARRTGRVSG